MKQITEDYVSFEIAQLLKEKGFKEIVQSLWVGADEYHYISTELIKPDDYNSGGTCLHSAPTHQMTLKWLREVHKLHIYAKPYWPQGDMRNKMSWQGFIVDLNTINGDSQCYADSYEEAIEKRIRFTLENLI